MPCRSDYMEPNKKERILQETAGLYSYALEESGERVPDPVRRAARNQYCTDDFVAHLCQLITSMDVDTRHRIVYNAHNKKSRQLADWWETHQAADLARQAQEAEEQAHVENLNNAFSKLNAQEIRALRRYFN